MRVFLIPLFLLLRLGKSNEQTEENEELSELPVIHTAFVQTGSELHYFSESSSHEALLFSGGQLKGSSKTWEATDEDSPLVFDPPILDFGDQSIGLPTFRRVRVKSRRKENVKLVSIMASSLNFHTTFFDKEKLASPDEDAWMDVAFLAREEGRVAGQLLVHVHDGTVHYQLLGTGAYNPYRLRPFIGTRLPINGTITRPLIVHNPHEHTFKITEVESSGGDVHVELAPKSENAVLGAEPADQMELRPFETRQIGNLYVVGGSEMNTTIFVRVAGHLIASSPIPKEFYVTFPIEVTKKSSIFPSTEYLDFGLIRHGDRSKPLNFSIYSSLARAIDFEQLYIDKGDGNLAYMEYITTPPIRVPPTKPWTLPIPTPLVKVWFESSRVTMEKKGPILKTPLGRIIAISRGGNFNTTIPFMAKVYQGELLVHENDLCFHDSLRPPFKRGVRLVNALPFGVAVWNVSLPEDLRPYMTIRLFHRITTIAPGESGSVFLLKYNKRAPVGFKSQVIVQTNVTDYSLPLTFYHGKVEVELYTEDQKTFDFGFLEKNDSRSIRFEIRNSNPATVWLRNMRVPQMDYMKLYKVGARENNETIVVYEKGIVQYGIDVAVAPNSTTIFDLILRLPPDASEDKESKDEFTFSVETDYESRHFPISYQISRGSLLAIPEELDFGKTHPGKLAYRSLKVFNAFDMDMTVTRLSSLEKDVQLHFDPLDSAKPQVLRSGRVTDLGRVLLHPSLDCPLSDCYLGMPLHTADGQWFVHGLNLPNNLAQVDNYLYRRVRGKFDKIVKENRHQINATVTIDTTHAKNIQVPVKGEFVWPRLLTRSSIHFPLTALGNFTIVNLTLQNPSSVPVVVQVIPLVIYPDADTLVNLFRDILLTPLTSQIEMNETLMFSLRDTELFTLKPDSPVPQLREELEKSLKMTVPRFTLSMLLKPHMKVRIRLGFLPSDYQLRSTLLLIRNNLTVIEPVTVYGRGARIGMQVGGIESRSRVPLLFEIRHDHLTDCSNPKRLMHQLTSTLTVRRPFLVQNTGEVPFSVVNMSISGVSCENRGFRILNCAPFRLAPNDTYEIHVAFTPDFLSHVNEADLQLYMHMNGSAWVYHIAATVPQDMMAKCHMALPRPPFENLMYYSCATVLAFTFVCVIACAYLEGDRAVTCSIKEIYSNIRPVFDLNNLTQIKDEVPKSPSKRPDIGTKPSTVHAREGDGALAKFFYSTANTVITVVHRLWSLTLLIRSTEDAQRPPNPPKRRGPVQARWREQRLKKKEAEQLTKTGKKIQPVAPIPNTQLQRETNKITAKPSVSPKASASTNGKKKKEVDQKEKEQRLERKMQLLDADHSVKESLLISTKRPNSRRQSDADDNQSSKSSTSINTSISAPRSQKSSKATAAVLPQMANTNERKLSEEMDYQRPSPQIQGSLLREPSISPERSQRSFSPETSHRFTRNSSPSALSETSDLPEWNDENVEAFGANIDDELTELALASEALFLNQDSDSGREQSMLTSTTENTDSTNNDKKKTQRGQRGGRRRSKGEQRRDSESSSHEPFNKSQASSSSGSASQGKPSQFIQELTKERRQKEEQYVKATLTTHPPPPQPPTALGDWPMPQLPEFNLLRPEELNVIINGPEMVGRGGRQWPLAPMPNDLSGFSGLGQSSSSMYPFSQPDRVYPHPNSAINPTNMNLNLGLDLGFSLFSDSNMWSTDVKVDPEQAWAGFTQQPQQEKEDHDENTK
ncbi:unnamed protein product, partial [Mesorhabditis belari]|uniref:Transmembrane protein 131 n=1 Tax=Mesorhabditis belari TaxID=2138241 RepID=A0AAF3E9N6_9BILA